MLTIEIGTSSAEVVADAASGGTTPTVEGAVVRVTIAGDIAALLPEGVPNPIELAPGQTIDIPLPDPLASRITAPHTATSTTADGAQRAEASAVGVDLFTGLPDGGVALAVGAVASEAAAAAPAQAPEAPTAAPDPGAGTSGPEALARTGGDGSLLLPVVLGGVSVAGLAAARRARRPA